VVGECIQSGGIGWFFLFLFGYGVFFGTQAAANIWLCIWSDNTNTPPLVEPWYGNSAAKLGMYGGIIGIEGNFTKHYIQ